MGPRRRGCPPPARIRRAARLPANRVPSATGRASAGASRDPRARGSRSPTASALLRGGSSTRSAPLTARLPAVDGGRGTLRRCPRARRRAGAERSEEHTSELQSPCNLVCRLLLEKKKKERLLCKRLCTSLTSQLHSQGRCCHSTVSRGCR